MVRGRNIAYRMVMVLYQKAVKIILLGSILLCSIPVFVVFAHDMLVVQAAFRP
jgi:hypothetical protein